MKINGKSTIQLFNSDGKEVYRTNEINKFESVLTNSVIPNNPDSVFDINHRKRADNAKVVEDAENKNE